MAVLDELKRQAGSRQNQRHAQAAGEAHGLAALHQALAAISGYFNDLAASLNGGGPQVVRTFVVQGDDCLRDLVQGDYFVRERKTTVEARQRFDQVALHFRAAGRKALELEAYADHAAERLRNYLHAYGLRLETRAFRNHRGVALKTVVTVLPDVPAAVTAAADPETATVRLKLRNVEAIGDAEYTYYPAEIGATLLDELGKLIVGAPNEFRTLGRHQEMLRMRIVACSAADERAPQLPAVQPRRAPEDARLGVFSGLKSLWKK